MCICLFLDFFYHSVDQSADSDTAAKQLQWWENSPHYLTKVSSFTTFNFFRNFLPIFHVYFYIRNLESAQVPKIRLLVFYLDHVKSVDLFSLNLRFYNSESFCARINSVFFTLEAF